MEVLMRDAFIHTDFKGSSYGDGDGAGHGSGGGYGTGSGDGSGYGDGHGTGEGHGYGDGYGSGFGYGDGYGSSFSYGDGYGHGSGSGDGDGYGYGYGSGIGYGDGYGDGSRLKSLNGKPVDMIDGVPTILTRIIGNVAKGFIVGPDFSLAPTFVYKQGNTFAHGETLHKAQEALLEKLFDDMPTEECIEAFCKEFKPSVKRPAMDFFSWHHRLTGSCEQGRREFALQHKIDLDKDELTPEDFFELTRNSYGGHIIQQTEKEFASSTSII